MDSSITYVLDQLSLDPFRGYLLHVNFSNIHAFFLNQSLVRPITHK